MFKLAHISDPHLGPLPEVRLSDLLSKRVFGWLNYTRSRADIHDMDVLTGIVRHLQETGCDHLAVTGDLANISLRQEFQAAQGWLEGLGTGADISLVPGNHDAYVPVPEDEGLALWSAYMRGDDGETGFPYMRVRGDVAIIGMSSAIPTLPTRATGAVETEQYKKAGKLLDEAHARGLMRIILIHHPPLPGLSPRYKRLIRPVRFTRLLNRHGAELVLHGHLHKTMVNFAEGLHGPVPVVGVPSASSCGWKGRELAAWHQYEIEKGERSFIINMKRYGLEEPDGDIKLIGRRLLANGR